MRKMHKFKIGAAKKINQCTSRGEFCSLCTLFRTRHGAAKKRTNLPPAVFLLTGDPCIFTIHNFLFSFYIFLILRRGDIVSLAEYIAEAARVFKTDLRRNFADVLICSQKQLFGFFKALGI